MYCRLCHFMVVFVFAKSIENRWASAFLQIKRMRNFATGVQICVHTFCLFHGISNVDNPYKYIFQEQHTHTHNFFLCSNVDWAQNTEVKRRTTRHDEEERRGKKVNLKANNLCVLHTIPICFFFRNIGDCERIWRNTRSVRYIHLWPYFVSNTKIRYICAHNRLCWCLA